MYHFIRHRRPVRFAFLRFDVADTTLHYLKLRYCCTLDKAISEQYTLQQQVPQEH